MGRRNGCNGGGHGLPGSAVTAAFWGRGGDDTAGREMHKGASF